MESTKTLFFASTVLPNPGEVQYWIDLKRDPYGNAIKSYDGASGKWVLLNYDSTIYRLFDILGIPYDKDTGEASWPNLGEGSVFGGDTLVDALENANRWATNVRDNVGKPGGLTPLNESGQVSSEFLPSYVDDVVEVWATYDTNEVGAISNIALWKNKECTTPITAAQAESDKIYVDIAPHKPNGETIKTYPLAEGEDVVYPSYQFRWSGSKWVWINGDHLIIGDITGTAFDGGRGHHLEEVAKALPPTILTESKENEYAEEYINLVFGKYSKSDLDTYAACSFDEKRKIDSATNEVAGVMPAYLYQFTYDIRNTLPDHLMTGLYLAEPQDDRVVIKTKSANKEYLTEPEDTKVEHVPYDKVSRNDKFVEEHELDDDKYLDDIVIPAASEAHAGVLTKDQFTKFDNTIPAKLESEIARSEAADAKHDKEIEDLKTRLGDVGDELSDAWLKHLEDFNDARQSVGLTDANQLPTLENTHYLNNDDEVEDDNVSSVVGCVTKLDDELYKLQQQVNDLPDYTKEKGEPNGLATLGEDGKVPTTELPGFVDDVIDVYATYGTTPTGLLTNINLFTDKEHTKAVQGEVGKIYVNITDTEANYQFRWSGTQFVHIDSNVLIIGDITGTAYDGGKGKKLETKSGSLPDTILSTYDLTQDNPDTITISLTGKTYNAETGSYDDSNLPDITVISATDTVAGLMSRDDKLKLDKAELDITLEIEERRKLDELLAERVGKLETRIENYETSINNTIDGFRTDISDWETQLSELNTKVDGAIESGTLKFNELTLKLEQETTARETADNAFTAKDTELAAKDAELEAAILTAKDDWERLLTTYKSLIEADIAELEAEIEKLKEKDIALQAEIDELKGSAPAAE